MPSLVGSEMCIRDRVRHNHRAAGLGDFAHLAIEILNGTRSVLAEHQPTDTVLRGIATTIVILHVVLRVVRIVDTCQVVVVVGIGYHLAFLYHISRLLGEHVAECVVSERGGSTCRVVDLRAAVAHVVNGCTDYESSSYTK